MNETTEKLYDKVNEHTTVLQKHSSAIESLVVTTEGISSDVHSLPEKLNTAIEKVYTKLDKHIEDNKPDPKWMIGTIGVIITILVSVASLWLSLTIEPIRNEIVSMSAKQGKIVEQRNELAASVSSAIASNASILERNATNIDNLDDKVDNWNALQNKYIDDARNKDAEHDKSLTEIYTMLRIRERPGLHSMSSSSNATGSKN